MKKANPNKETKSTTFSELLRTYETEYRKDRTSKEFADALQNLGQAVAYSVVRKCLNVSANEQLEDVKRSIYRDTHTLKNINYSSEQAFETVYNQNGEEEKRTKDSDYRYAYNKLSTMSLGEGMDLVHTAIMTLLEETKKVDISADCFLESRYTERVINKRVHIQQWDNANIWKEEEISPIQKAFRAVRADIYNASSLTIDNNGYTYIDSTVTNDDTGAIEKIYRRLDKYSDLGGYATDYNGACTLYSVESQTVDDMDALIEKLELTERQTIVLKYRLRGYGYKAIATHLGVKPESIKEQVKAIRKKAIKNGLNITK